MSKTAGGSVTVFAVGDFGVSVAENLNRLRSDVDVRILDLHNYILAVESANSAVLILVSGSLLPSISEAIDSKSHQNGTTFIPLWLQDCGMYLGPIVVPGGKTCWRCWSAQELDLPLRSPLEVRRREFYAKTQAASPRGFLSSLAMLGACQLSNELERLGSCGSRANQLIRTDMISLDISSRETTGLDNCNRCGLRRRVETRSHADLRKHLASLWTFL
jgi:hypothetical protein